MTSPRGGRADRRQQLDNEVEMGVGHEQRRRVGADRHERAVTEGDLAVQPGQEAQAGQGDHVQGDLADLEIVVGAQRRRDQIEDGGADHGQAGVAGERLRRQTEPADPRRPARRCLGDGGTVVTLAGRAVGRRSLRAWP